MYFLFYTVMMMMMMTTTTIAQSFAENTAGCPQCCKVFKYLDSIYGQVFKYLKIASI